MRFIRNALAAALVAGAVVVGIATPAIAVPQLVAASVAEADPIFVFDGIPTPVLIGLVTGAVIPALVGLIARLVDKVTNGTFSPLAKGVVLSLLSVISGAVTSIGQALTDSVPINLGILVTTAASAFVMSVATYFGLLSRESRKGRSIAGVIKGDSS